MTRKAKQKLGGKLKMSLELSEITIERVKLAYKRTGLKPGKFASRYSEHLFPGNRCCPLEALAKDLGLPHFRLVLKSPQEQSLFAYGYDGGCSLDKPAANLGNTIALALGIR